MTYFVRVSIEDCYNSIEFDIHAPIGSAKSFSVKELNIQHDYPHEPLYAYSDYVQTLSSMIKKWSQMDLTAIKEDIEKFPLIMELGENKPVFLTPISVKLYQSIIMRIENKGCLDDPVIIEKLNNSFNSSSHSLLNSIMLKNLNPENKAHYCPSKDNRKSIEELSKELLACFDAITLALSYDQYIKLSIELAKQELKRINTFSVLSFFDTKKTALAAAIKEENPDHILSALRIKRFDKDTEPKSFVNFLVGIKTNQKTLLPCQHLKSARSTLHA